MWPRPQVPLLGHVMAFGVVLGPYAVFPWILISGASGAPDPSASRCGCALLCYAVGVAIMMCADCQKTFTLRYKRGLITEGMCPPGVLSPHSLA